MANSIYKTSIAMTAIIASLGCGMTTSAMADQTTPQSDQVVSQSVEAPTADTKTTDTPATGTKDDTPAATTVAKIGDTAYTTLADAVKAAKDGDTITLTGKITGNTTIDKKIILQGTDGNQVNGTITVTAAGATVRNVSFVFDQDTTKGDKTDMRGAALSQLIVKADNVTVEANSFTITRDANTTRQLNAVWVQNAKTTKITGNNFNIATHARYLTDQTKTGTDSWSWVAVNLIGGVDKTGASTVSDVTITRNTMTVGEGDRLDAAKLPEASKGKNLSGQVNLLVANGNDTARQGVTNVTVSNNTVVNASKLADTDANLYGLTLMGTSAVNVSNNTFAGTVAVATSHWGTQAGSLGLTYTGNTDNTSKGVSFGSGSYAGTVDYSDNTGTAGATLVKTDNGTFTTISESVDASKDGHLTLLGDFSEKFIVPEGRSPIIDLNGHSLSGDIENNGTLTLTDSSEAQTGTASGAITGKGKLTITGGKYAKLPDGATIPEGYGTVTDKDGVTSVVKAVINTEKPTVEISAKDGKIDEKQIIALTGATVNLPGYDLKVTDMKPVNDLIEANKTGQATVELQIMKDGKTIGDPITVTVNVTGETVPVHVTVKNDKITVNVKDGKLDEATLLKLVEAKADNDGATLSVDAKQLEALNQAIDTNTAGDVVVGVIATLGDSTDTTPVTVTVQAIDFTANDFDWKLTDGYLTADKILELAKPTIKLDGYKYTIDSKQVDALNALIDAKKPTKAIISITASGENLPTLTKTVTINLTDTKPSTDDAKKDEQGDKLAHTGVTLGYGMAFAGLLSMAGVAATLLRKRLTNK
ncbi:hypothetical protein [Bifidobacterium callitrichidarum]|uniref:Uncharacterized protein n=1 Tax=Bifidobacterium callitrichidarum TaxID=2052941 RepID=A0A2U2NC09_9BIFI|nr:hypothetical protein [Bifidobacterium callitrichidarum]PWG66643.1 hypothetical protein DF196_01710 [Bifidobacterium callitrichidarum]